MGKFAGLRSSLDMQEKNKDGMLLVS